MITWGKNLTGDSGMKAILWIIVIYEGVVGAAELASSAMGSSSTGTSGALVTVAELPSVGSLLTSSSVAMGGVVDLAIAGGVYAFGLHKHF